jgi:hypothetical protein
MVQSVETKTPRRCAWNATTEADESPDVTRRIALSHHTIPISPVSGSNAAERFWSKVDKTGGPDACWPWLAGKTPLGYGRARWGGQTIYSHRVAFVVTTGEDITGWVICHSCDNPSCCNPKHLWSGTQRDNMRDRERKGRGHNGLDQEQRDRIKALREAGAPAVEIMAAVGCCRHAVHRYGGADPGRKPRYVLSEADISECVRLRSDGLRYQDIAGQVGASTSSVWKAVNRR